MQIAGSQTGISSASERFSKQAVPTGKVPSTGRALTGSSSPRPAIIAAVTCATKSGAPAGTGGSIPEVAVTSAGSASSNMPPIAASIAA